VVKKLGREELDERGRTGRDRRVGAEVLEEDAELWIAACSGMDSWGLLDGEGRVEEERGEGGGRPQGETCTTDLASVRSRR
jgi:hypothetical protein